MYVVSRIRMYGRTTGRRLEAKSSLVAGRSGHGRQGTRERIYARTIGRRL